MGSIPKPVAPYDTDIRRAAKNCFDRETGEPVSSDLLMTYVEALSTYHLHPETKFGGGMAFDRGVTQRQIVEAVAVNCIGKEANRWEEQFYLGLNLDAQIDYGLTPRDMERLRSLLKTAVEEGCLGQREIARRVGISRTTLAKLVTGKSVRNDNDLIRRVSSVVVEAEREKEHAERERARLNTTRPKDQWLDKTGGFRFGETGIRLKCRVAEIDRLEQLLRSGRIGAEAAELILHRLRQLKGIYFEDHNPEDK
jgi:transcriptional regulator with XRE-family HTH domain